MDCLCYTPLAMCYLEKWKKVRLNVQRQNLQVTETERKAERGRRPKKATHENFNPTLLVKSTDSYKVFLVGKKYLQLAQPVERVTVKDLSLCQMPWLYTQGAR